MSESPKAPTKGRERLIIGLILFFGTIAIHWPTTGFEFVNLDDPSYVYDNPTVKQGLTWNTVKWAFTSTESSLWFPITRLAHLATWQIFGSNSGGHHLVNFVIHALNALLAFLVFERMTGALWRSAFFAALFAWHPLRVESVTWVAELKDVLAVLFWLLTMACYVRFVRTRRTKDHLLLVATYALGMMCKPTLVMLPFALLLIDIWPLRRLDIPKYFRASTPGKSAGDPVAATETRPALSIITWRRAILEKVPLIVISIVLMGVTLVTASEASASNIPLSIRISNAFLSYARYLGKTFYPVDLAVLYPHYGNWFVWQVALAFLLCLVISLAALSAARKLPYFFSGWFWFLVTILPNIGLIQAGPQAMADRFTYIPSIGLTMAVVWTVAGIARHFPFGSAGLGFLGAIAVAACVGVTRHQITFWKDSIVLFEHALATTPETDIPHYNLGIAFAAKGENEKAISHYEASLRFRPDSDNAWNNLGIVYARLNQPAKALEYYDQALRLNPSNVGARFNHALAQYLGGHVDTALTEFNETLAQAPQHQWAWYWIGRIQAERGQTAEALRSFNRVLEINPKSNEAHYELGVLRMAQGDAASAVRHFRTVIELKPEDAAVYAKLGLALSASGQPAEAAAEYQRALSFNPNSIEPLNNLAWLLATHPNPSVRNGAEAVRLATRACQVTSNQVPTLIGTLAAAYAEANRFEEAGQAARLAETVATQLGETNVAQKNRELQQLFQERKPVRQP